MFHVALALDFVEWESHGFPSLVAGSASMLWFFIACLVIWLPVKGKACVLPFGGCVLQFSGMDGTELSHMILSILTLIVWITSGTIITAWYIRSAAYLYTLTSGERVKKIKRAVPTISLTLLYILFWLPCLTLAVMVATGYSLRRETAYFAQCLMMMNGIMSSAVYGLTNENYRQSFTELCSIRHRRTIPVNYPAAKAKVQRRGIMHDRRKQGIGFSTGRNKRTKKISVKPMNIPDF